MCENESPLPSFRKIEPGRIGFGDFPLEIREQVYTEYFKGSSDVFPVVYTNGMVCDCRRKLGHVIEKLESEKHKAAKSTSVKQALLLVNKSLSIECLPFLYHSTTFNIVQGGTRETNRPRSLPQEMKTNLPHKLPQKMKNNVRTMSLDIDSLPYKISRLDSSSAVDDSGKRVSLRAWYAAASEFPNLEVLIIKCREFLEARNLALRFAIKPEYKTVGTNITFNLCLFGEVGARTGTPWAGWPHVKDEVTTVVVSGVKNLVIEANAMYADKDIIEAMTFNDKYLEFTGEEMVRREPFKYREFESFEAAPLTTSAERTLRTYRLAKRTSQGGKIWTDEVDEAPGLRRRLNDHSAPKVMQSDNQPRQGSPWSVMIASLEYS